MKSFQHATKLFPRIICPWYAKWSRHTWTWGNEKLLFAITKHFNGFMFLCCECWFELKIDDFFQCAYVTWALLLWCFNVGEKI